MHPYFKIVENIMDNILRKYDLQWQHGRIGNIRNIESFRIVKNSEIFMSLYLLCQLSNIYKIFLTMWFDAQKNNILYAATREM